MGNLFKTGIAVTFVAGFIFSRCLPIHMYFGNQMETQLWVQGVFVGSTLLYFAYVLWKSMAQRIWVRIPLIFGMLFSALILGYVLVGFVIQPILLSTTWTFRLLAGNESNIVWYWPFGISLILYVLFGGITVFSRMIRGETFLF